MSRDLTFVRNAPLFSSNTANDRSPLSITADVSSAQAGALPLRKSLLRALQADDWQTFEAIAMGDNPDIDIETDRYDNGQNCLHVAIRSGCNRIALNLVKLAVEWDIDLINHQDQAGYTPIMAATEADTDKFELIDALLEAGAHVGLPDALKSAAQKNHTQTAQRLMRTDANQPAMLAELAQDHQNPSALMTAKRLIALGMNPTCALEHASQKHWRNAERTLILLGAKGADVLVTAATRQTAKPTTRTANLTVTTAILKNLLQAGADVATALVKLAAKFTRKENIAAARLLTRTDQHCNQFRARPQTSNDTPAILRLAKHGNTRAIRELSAAIEPEDLGVNELATGGDIAAIRALIDACHINLERMLPTMALASNVRAIRILIDAGLKTATSVRQLYEEYRLGFKDRLDAIKLLVVLGAESSALPQGINFAIDARQVEISRLSPSERQAAFHVAIETGAMADIVMLFDQGVDTLAALQHLVQVNDTHGIGVMIDVGAVTPATLIERVRAGDMTTARAIARARDIATTALIDVLAQQDTTLARAFIPALTDGHAALGQAAQSGDLDLVDALLEIRVDGPRVLLSLLDLQYHEAAARLVARSVDVHKTLMLAIEAHQHELQASLTVLGADPRLALQRAIELKHFATAQRILAHADRSLGQQALSDLIDDDTLPDDLKTQRLRFFIQAGVDTDEAMQNLIDDRKIAALKTLIALGAPTDNLLIALGRRGNRIDAQTLMLAGADFTAPIRTLENNHEQQAVTTLTLALTVVRDRKLQARQLNGAAEVALQQV